MMDAYDKPKEGTGSSQIDEKPAKKDVSNKKIDSEDQEYYSE